MLALTEKNMAVGHVCSFLLPDIAFPCSSGIFIMDDLYIYINQQLFYIILDPRTIMPSSVLLVQNIKIQLTEG